jgi:hypothetical protein
VWALKRFFLSFNWFCTVATSPQVWSLKGSSYLSTDFLL